MVDNTTYADAAHTPELALRQLFVASRLPEPLRRAIADMNLVTIDHIASIGDSLDRFKVTIQAMLTLPVL